MNSTQLILELGDTLLKTSISAYFILEPKIKTILGIAQEFGDSFLKNTDFNDLNFVSIIISIILLYVFWKILIWSLKQFVQAVSFIFKTVLYTSLFLIFVSYITPLVV
jgi:hypothetical protein